MCCAGSTKDIKWSNVKVGQVLKVMSDEDIPADLLTLYCHLEDNVCYIKTTNLDGELWSPSNAAAPPCVTLVFELLCCQRALHALPAEPV